MTSGFIMDILARFLFVSLELILVYEILYSPQMVERAKTNNNNFKKLHAKNTIVI